MTLDHVREYFENVTVVAGVLQQNEYVETIERMVRILKQVRQKQGRLFILGVGGSAANASHAVNDFRKLCNIEAYAPTDNVAELTARTNDEGWGTVFAKWLKVSRLGPGDALLVFSVGGGDAEKKISINIVHAIRYAKECRAKVLAVVGRADGVAAQTADCVIVVPVINPKLVTPLSEAFQAVIWHCLVSHPNLQQEKTTW